MDVDAWAALGLLAASIVGALVVSRLRTRTGQTFSTQVGDQVLQGSYRVIAGQVHVVTPAGSKSAPLGLRRASHVADLLLAQIYSDQVQREATGRQ